MPAHSKHMNRAHSPPCRHSARGKYTKQSASQLLTAVQVWTVCVSAVDWHLPVCYCILQSTVPVFTIATVAVTTARRTTTTAATITVTSIGGSVGRSVEGLWKQKDRFQTATSNVLTPLLTSEGNNRARPYLQQCMGIVQYPVWGIRACLVNF